MKRLWTVCVVGVAVNQWNKVPLQSDQVSNYAEKSNIKSFFNCEEQSKIYQNCTPPGSDPSRLDLFHGCLALAMVKFKNTSKAVKYRRTTEPELLKRNNIKSFNHFNNHLPQQKSR